MTEPNEEGLIERTMVDPPKAKPWWQSRKLGYIILSMLSMVLGVATGQVELTGQDLLLYSLGVAGVGVGGHVASDIAFQRRQPPTP